MAGCPKADKKRKSVQNVAYKAGNRAAVNKEKHIAKHKKAMEHAASKVREVERGMTRKIRRAEDRGL